MKKSFAILFFFGCSFVIHAQQYYPFIEEGKTWAELNVFQPGYPDPPYTAYSTVSFKLEGDTLFEGHTWKKLFTTGDNPVTGNWQQEFCLYREEGSKVYCYCDIIAGEELMYDFSLNVGDSVYYEGLDWWMYVVETDSVEVNGTVRRRIQFDDPAEVWIEGLGSTCRPFQPIEGQFILPGGYSLLCVSNSDGIVYQDPAYSACFVDTTITAVSGTGLLDNQVRVFSNAANREIVAIITDTPGAFNQYQLYDMGGKQIRCGKFNGKEISISTEGLNPGILVLRLMGEKAAITRKVEVVR